MERYQRFFFRLTALNTGKKQEEKNSIVEQGREIAEEPWWIQDERVGEEVEEEEEEKEEEEGTEYDQQNKGQEQEREVEGDFPEVEQDGAWMDDMNREALSKIQEEKEVQRVMKQMLRSLSGMLKQEEKMLKQEKEENLSVTKRNVVPMIG